MKFQDYYDIDVKFQSKSLDLSSGAINFSIHDSIHNFFSNSNIVIQDNTGLYHESLLNIPGNEFEIFFADPDNRLQSKFIVFESQSNEPKTQGTLNGDIELSCIHKYYSQQKETNFAYKNQASKIVENIINDCKFSYKDIKSTNSSIVLYRMSQTQKDFINDVVIPNSFSDNCDFTPFYAFIDTENRFNFKNWNEMVSTSPIENLYYSNVKISELDKNKIFTIKSFSKNLQIYSKNINRKLFYRNYSTGEFFTESSNIFNYPKNRKGYLIPVVKLDTESYSNESIFYNDFVRKETTKARIINSNKNTMSLEYFEITLPFNSKICSGKTIQLEVSTVDEKSLYNSGIFLVEDCIHTWDGRNRRGFTTIIISRKLVNVPSNYRLRDTIYG